MVRSRFFHIIGIFLLLSSMACNRQQKPVSSEAEFAGSESCIECHERFYHLWSSSHHGKAMQPVNRRFFETESLPSSKTFLLEEKTYRIIVGDSTIILNEQNGDSIKQYDVVWALGGKNVFYFLTQLEKGKLQTIPLAYDVNRKIWYNNPASAVRHFPDNSLPRDEALSWKDRMYSFNTSCYGCHVSQLEPNFNLETDSYNTIWKEPGINCETCHGPSAAHVRLLKNAKEGEEFEDIGLIVTKTFTPQQHNESCAPCHAKMHPITASYLPGDRFFDNYDLTTFENSDFYPDGRDLGENYTYTGWMMNECKAGSDLHCVTCHTSSGRNRFAENPNDACAKCHAENVANVEVHSGHKTGSEGAICVNCHMPKTEFGRMIRSDHSFRPPMPEASIKFGSPNACNNCHTDKTAEWANAVVKKRKHGNYQYKTLEWTQLLNEARNNNWTNLDKMVDIIDSSQLNEVVIASFIRTLANCKNDKKWASIIYAISNKSVLVRAAAAAGLTGNVTQDAKNALLTACTDEFRLVRISAAVSLAAFSSESFTAEEAKLVTSVTGEYIASVLSRPDDWSAHYNLGVFHQNRGEITEALESYENAARLYPESEMPLINSSMLYSYLGESKKAEERLKTAIKYSPKSEAANLNLGLLLAEQGRPGEAEKAFKKVLEINPSNAVAAYNLSVIAAQENIAAAVGFAKIAAESNPEELKYLYTLAFYQFENKERTKAVKTLKTLLENHPGYFPATRLLVDIFLKEGNKQAAVSVYERVLETEGISADDKENIRRAISAIQQNVSN